MNHRFSPAFLSAVFVLSLPNPVSAETLKIEKQVAKGVAFFQEIETGGGGSLPRIVNVLRIDLKEPGVKLQYGQANDVIGTGGDIKGREGVGTLAVRNRAVGGVNGDYFAWSADPLGLGIQNGELISEPMDFRACVALMEDRVEIGVMAGEGVVTLGQKTPLLVNGINRIPHDGELIVETPRFAGASIGHKAGIIVQVNETNLPLKVSQELTGKVETISPIEQSEPLPICPHDKVLLIAFGDTGRRLAQSANQGDAVSLRFDLTPNLSAPSRGKYPSRAGRAARRSAAKPTWQEAKQAVSGGPWLVKEGKVSIDYEAEGFNAAEFVAKRHPRTAFGVTRDGRVLLVTVDGREEWSAGVSLRELAGLLLKYGAVNGINLDGGGSTSMFVGGGIVNAPSDGRLRPVANGLLVFADPLDTPDLNSPHLVPASDDGVPLHVGDRQTFHVVGGDGSPLPAGVQVIWGTEDGLGFITQGGTFRSLKAGRGTITARVGGLTLRTPVNVTH